MRKVYDFLGRDVRINDQIVWPVQRGHSISMRSGQVKKINETGSIGVSVGSDDRLVSIRLVQNVVVICTLLMAMVIGVANDGRDWALHFPAHALNVGVNVWQQCRVDGKLVWTNSPFVNIQPDWNKAVFHREVKGIPRGASCFAEFALVRNPGGGAGDTKDDYEVKEEMARITWTQ